MVAARERILLVENDPEISDIIARQALRPLGYRVEIVLHAAAAIQEASRFMPDLVIADLSLPGLSGKDLLIALTSQGLQIPVIVLSRETEEGDILHAFRIGASDFLIWPVREAEVVSAVERALRMVRDRRERDALAQRLNRANQELEEHIRQLKMLNSIGKAVTSLTNLNNLLEKILDGALYVTKAERGLLLMRQDKGDKFLIGALRNMPPNVNVELGRPWDDGLSSLVSQSGESLIINGEPLKPFPLFSLGKAALIVPIKAKKEVIGLITMLREKANPFDKHSQTLAEAVADYASIALVNSRLFRALEVRAKNLEKRIEAKKGVENPLTAGDALSPTTRTQAKPTERAG